MTRSLNAVRDVPQDAGDGIPVGLDAAVAESEAPSADTAASISMERAEGLVKNATIAAMAVGLVPLPAVGVVGLLATNLSMLQALSTHYGVPFRRDLAKSSVLSLLAGVLPVGLGVGLSELLKLVPGFGSLAGAAGTSILAGTVTYAVGTAFNAHFASGGTFLTLDIAEIRKSFVGQLTRGRQVAAELAKKVKPKPRESAPAE